MDPRGLRCWRRCRQYSLSTVQSCKRLNVAGIRIHTHIRQNRTTQLHDYQDSQIMKNKITSRRVIVIRTIFVYLLNVDINL